MIGIKHLRWFELLLCVKMMAGGGLSAARVEELEQKRAEFGLSEAAAQKIIKGAQNKQLIDNMNVSLHIQSSQQYYSLPYASMNKYN